MAMRKPAFPTADDRAIIAGESGATGLAGLMRVAMDSASQSALALDQASRLLLFNTEGATDPELYRRLVGAAATSTQAECV